MTLLRMKHLINAISKMDIDINSIINHFVKNFVKKDIQEKSVVQLKDDTKRGEFTVKLNHHWDTILDMRSLSKISSDVNAYEFVTKSLNIEKYELWYIISNHHEIDGQIAEFKVALDKVYGRGLGSLIINLSGDKLYLKTAKENRFTGKIQD